MHPILKSITQINSKYIFPLLLILSNWFSHKCFGIYPFCFLLHWKTSLPIQPKERRKESKLYPKKMVSILLFYVQKTNIH